MSKTKSRPELDSLASEITTNTTTHLKSAVFECPFSKIVNEKTSYKGIDKDMYIYTKNSLGGAFILAEKDNQILLICQYRSASKSISYEIPAGNIDTQEDPVRAAKRELLEETGYVARKIIPIGECFIAPGFSNLKSYFFLATDLSFEKKNQEPSETILDQNFFSLEEIKTMILDSRINDGPSIAGMLHYILHKK